MGSGVGVAVAVGALWLALVISFWGFVLWLLYKLVMHFTGAS